MPFSITIDSPKLSKGLRPSKRMPRNSGYLIECQGCVGRDGVLQVLDELSRLSTTAITDTFPFPQIFVFTNLIIVCSNTVIYEWVAGTLVEKLTVTAGALWTAIDFYDFVYMSNGNVAVLRDPGSQEYSVTADQPRAMALCNFNGQVLAGATDIEGGVPGASLAMKADSIDVTVTQRGWGEWWDDWYY
jgi:hypothetical protein